MVRLGLKRAAHQHVVADFVHGLLERRCKLLAVLNQPLHLLAKLVDRLTQDDDFLGQALDDVAECVAVLGVVRSIARRWHRRSGWNWPLGRVARSARRREKQRDARYRTDTQCFAVLDAL